MYLDYATYQELGGTDTEQVFTRNEAVAEDILDDFTLRRLRVDSVAAKWVGSREVNRAMFILVGMVPEIESQESQAVTSGPVSSFSNGQNSFGFSSEDISADGPTRAMMRAYVRVEQVLPVDLISACARYNHAN